MTRSEFLKFIGVASATIVILPPLALLGKNPATSYEGNKDLPFNNEPPGVYFYLENQFI